MDDSQKKILLFGAAGCLAFGGISAMLAALAVAFLLGARQGQQQPAPVTPPAPAQGAGQPGAVAPPAQPENPPGAQPEAQPVGEPAAVAGPVTKKRRGHVSGHIVGADGKPIHLAGAVIRVSIGGQVGAGFVSYQPPVDAEGFYDTPVAGGVYRGMSASIDFPFQGKRCVMQLCPLQDVETDQWSESGIVLDFMWKLTGPTYLNRLDPKPDNFTHWYGCQIHTSFNVWREDLRKIVPALPRGTKATFTLTPKGPCADGSPSRPLTQEVTLPADGWWSNGGCLFDIPLAPYTVTGTLTLPDGSHEPALLYQGKTYVESVDVAWAPGSSTGMWPFNLSFTRKSP